MPKPKAPPVSGASTVGGAFVRPSSQESSGSGQRMAGQQSKLLSNMKRPGSAESDAKQGVSAFLQGKATMTRDLAKTGPVSFESARAATPTRSLEKQKTKGKISSLPTPSNQSSSKQPSAGSAAGSKGDTPDKLKEMTKQKSFARMGTVGLSNIMEPADGPAEDEFTDIMQSLKQKPWQRPWRERFNLKRYLGRKCSAVAASCRKSKVKSEKEQELELGREILSSRIKRKMRQLDTGEDTSQYPACEKAWFNYLYIFIIICHLIFIGYDTDRMGAALKSGEYTSSNKLEQGGDGLVCWIIEGVFITLFFIEAYIKIKTNGFEYFDSLNNQMDFSLVTLGLVDVFVLTPSGQDINVDFLYTLRLVRTFRIARLINFFPSVREKLEALVRFDYKTMATSAFWIILLGMLTSNMFSMLFTTLIGKAFETYRQYERKSGFDVQSYFGTILQTTRTLMRIMTKDDGIIGEIMRPVMEVQPEIFPILLVYYAVHTWALMGVLIGMIVSIALKGAGADREEEDAAEEKRKALRMIKINELFHMIDADGNGMVDKDELTAAVESEEFKSLFLDVGVPADEALELFDVVDINGDGELNIDEFCGGCVRMYGDVKSKDLYVVGLSVQNMNDRVDVLELEFETAAKRAKDIQNLTSRMDGVQRKRDAEKFELKPGLEKRTFKRPDYAIPPFSSNL